MKYHQRKYKVSKRIKRRLMVRYLRFNTIKEQEKNESASNCHD
ncbi:MULTISPECIES: hypothetical protein [unclassified Motilimonas]|nr:MULTISPECIES: hypothetical protein [unclassified Motilimonas]MDO6527009.1 hypothetical protein [Motilimonas sp. 1_MG-2023]